MKIDFAIRVTAAGTLPVDHGYLLYSALSRMQPYIHQSPEMGVHAIRGCMVGNRRLELREFSRVTIRANVDDIRHLVPLNGSQINIAGTRLMLGVAELRQIVPAADLRSRLVVIKLSHSPNVPCAAFLDALSDQLRAIDATPTEIVIGVRRTLRIKDKEIVGYEVCLNGLSSEDSLRVQEIGLGGRHHMGAGLFLPYDSTQWKLRQPSLRMEVIHA